MNIHTPIREWLLTQGDICALLGEWEDVPAIHTRRPVPADTGTPFVIAPSTNAAAGNMDGLTTDRPILIRDLVIYGVKDADYRAVDTAAEMIADRLHRNRFALAIEGWKVIDIEANRPIPAPADGNKDVGRLVSLRIRLQRG